MLRLLSKNYVLLVGYILISIIGCKIGVQDRMDVVSTYYEARSAVDFELTSKSIHDSITIIEGSYVMPYDKLSFYEVFKWDSIFQPKYNLIKVEEDGEHLIASVTLQSIRNDFLQNNAMTCQFKFSFVNNKIAKIETLDCPDADWPLWQLSVNQLVNWTKDNHPELDGFINDMTMEGALKYKQAIEWYKLSH